MQDGLGSQWRSAPPYWPRGHLFVSEHRRDRIAARAALISSALIVVTLVIFFIWVFPANQATSNWTAIPDGWAELRRYWDTATLQTLSSFSLPCLPPGEH